MVADGNNAIMLDRDVLFYPMTQTWRNNGDLWEGERGAYSVKRRRNGESRQTWTRTVISHTDLHILEREPFQARNTPCPQIVQRESRDLKTSFVALACLLCLAGKTPKKMSGPILRISQNKDFL